ncbi:methionine adenosyltransferase [Candidatus Dojkabacteria bacterium]|jgi:S-adenosylmethionine synthetase|nr:methionine adenosyltransferase [Candidatus Dojkabacteria bacterium]
MKLITSESVSFGHPDKIADQISDALLDAYLEQDENSKVAIETMVKDNMVIVGGEVKSNAIIDIKPIIMNLVKDIGYTDPEHGFYYKNLSIINIIGEQSNEINKAVDAEELGAGDQGFMVGYATNETSEYMPLGMYISRKIVNHVVKIGFGPDAKSQTTIEHNDNNIRIHTILVSACHKNDIDVQTVRKKIKDEILSNAMNLDKKVFDLFDKNLKIVINPAGSWNVGGPVSDCGLTGRKIVVDQYGPYCPVGGGAFSGKDFSKVDRSGAYLARYIAKNIVATGIANKCKVEIAYMIGVAEPASLSIDTFGMANDEKLLQIVKQIFPLKPKEIIDKFNLKKPIYQDTAKNGHFGYSHYAWEQLDKVKSIVMLYFPNLQNPRNC